MVCACVVGIGIIINPKNIEAVLQPVPFPVCFFFIMSIIGERLVINHPWFIQENDDDLPLGSLQAMITAVACYVVGVAFVSWLMRKRRAEGRPLGWVKPLSAVHNIIMALYSLYAFIGSTSTFLHNYRLAGSDPMILLCDPERKMGIGAASYWYYTFYLSKFFEFIDSFFLVLNAKPLLPPGRAQYVLHMFHHSTTGTDQLRKRKDQAHQQLTHTTCIQFVWGIFSVWLLSCVCYVCAMCRLH